MAKAPAEMTPDERQAAADAVARAASKADEATVAAGIAADAAKQIANAGEDGANVKIISNAAEVIDAFVKKQPNNGKLTLNNLEFTLPPAGEKVRIPRGFALAFPEYLAT